MKNKVFIIIDGNSVLHRAFHALPMLTGKDGVPAGAVYGFVLALYKAVEDFRPDYIAACFDTKAPTFRHAEFADYKAQRPETAKDLVPQFEKIRKLLEDFKIAVFSLDGYEADDLIASVVRAAKSDPRSEITDFFVLTGDYDSLQLVDGRVRAYIINRGIKNAVLYDEMKVKETFGVWPKLIPDLKALAGDVSDNIPGAPGIGPKGAVEILSNYTSLEELYAAAEKDPENFSPVKSGNGAKIKSILLENKEKIMHFKRLATMASDAPVGDVFNGCAFDNFSGPGPSEALLELGFASLAKRLPQGKISRNGTLF
jgi:DNA polymerase-1